jgi:hypothetical protein
MGLIGNYSVLSKTCGFTLGGSTESGDRGNFSKASANRNRHLGGYAQFNSTPSGYVAPHCWVLAKIGGGMATFRNIQGEGGVTAGNLAGGLNAVAPLTGSGTISNAALALILSAVAALTGSGTLTASILGKLEAVADLAGSGDIAGALGALADMEADLTGTGALDAVLSALAGISADIVVTGTGLTTANVGEAVWAAIAVSNNTAGSMGEKLNDAGSASNPWTEVIESGYTAAEILRIIAASTAGKTTGAGTSNMVFTGLDGTTNRIDGTLDASGNRTAVTLDGA